MEFKVLVDTFDKVEKFVEITNESSHNIDLLAGKRTYLDAKSIMGILSCNICEPMTIIVNGEEDEDCEMLREQLVDYIV